MEWNKCGGSGHNGMDDTVPIISLLESRFTFKVLVSAVGLPSFAERYPEAPKPTHKPLSFCHPVTAFHSEGSSHSCQLFILLSDAVPTT